MVNRKGISLIELVLTTALIGLVIQVVYSLFFVGSLSHSVSSNKGFAQQDIRFVADFVESELKTASIITTDVSGANWYYSLEVEDDTNRKTLTKYYNWYNDNGTDDPSDDFYSKDVVKSFSGNWNKLIIAEYIENVDLTNPIKVLIQQEEGTGRGKSSYQISYGIDLINGGSIADTTLNVNLVEGEVLYYRNTPSDLSTNGIYVSGVGDSVGDEFRVLTFMDSIENSVMDTFTAKAGVPIEWPETMKAGYSFVEWNTEEDGTGVRFEAGDVMEDYDFSLYAIWEEVYSPVVPFVSGVTLASVDGNLYNDIPNLPSTRIGVKKGHNINFKFVVNGTYLNEDDIVVKINSNNPATTSSPNSIEFSTTYKETANGKDIDMRIRVLYKNNQIFDDVFYFITHN